MSLYDPNEFPEAPVKDDLVHQFLEFARSKPRDEEYCYCSNGECAFAQFLVAHGYSNAPNVGADAWTDTSGKDHPLDRRLALALSLYGFGLPNGGRTFGLLADRLEAALEQVSS